MIEGQLQGPHGERPYQLFVPEKPCGSLIVMLHGCDQDPQDFARGTRMNEAAPHHHVLYPQQPRSFNSKGCWNWFYSENQQRGRGEPALLMDMIEKICAEQTLRRDRIYVAGMSAGGCMAAILAEVYPEMFAAAGLHSALTTGSATGLLGALAAMRGFHRKKLPPMAVAIPTLVFQGDADRVVHPRNAERLVARLALGSPISEVVTGSNYTRTVYGDKFESWSVHGLSHAWSGGSKEGSYTDPAGPDATREMLRFFGKHPTRTHPTGG